jgi:hypothetical protein
MTWSQRLVKQNELYLQLGIFNRHPSPIVSVIGDLEEDSVRVGNMLLAADHSYSASSY